MYLALAASYLRYTTTPKFNLSVWRQEAPSYSTTSLPPPPAMFANSPISHAVKTSSSCSSSDLDARKETLASWRNLEEEFSDLQDLIAQFSSIVTVVAGVRR